MSEYSKIDVGGFDAQSSQKNHTGKKRNDKIKEIDEFSDRKQGFTSNNQ